MADGTDDGPGAWERLDRHALVMSIWLALGFVATALLARGFQTTQGLPVYGAFVVVIAGFVGHIIINAVSDTRFSAREVALGLVIYALGLVGFLFALLLRSETVLALFMPLSIGLLALTAVAVFYMVTHFGARGAFRAFDVISDFGPDEVRRRDAQG